MTFKPMLCGNATVMDVEAGLFSPLEWTAERKLDGIRAYVVKGRLYNRRGKDITEKFPELRPFVRVTEERNCLIDGEIVAQSGEFNDMSGRAHMKDKLYIKVAAESSPCMFVAFDMIRLASYHEQPSKHDVPNGRQVMRRGRLDTFFITEVPYYFKDGEQMSTITKLVDAGEPKEMLERAKKNGWEGIILKRKQSTYQQRRSADWVKVKLFIEVQHRFTKFEEHPRGITIEDSEGRRVVVNGGQADAVKTIIQQEGSVKAEIQFLPQRNSTAWRFPSFRGIVREAKDNGSTRENQ